MDLKKTTFPKGFFTQSRPHLTIKEAIKDDKPLSFSKPLKGNKNRKMVSKKTME